MRAARPTRTRVAAIGLALAGLACGADSQAPPPLGEAHAAAGGVAVFVPRIPEPAADVAALYLVVIDQDGRGDRLIGAQSEIGEAMLHETREAQGLVQMQRAAAGLVVPAHGELRLEPGGAHVMLMGLQRRLEAGARVHVTLEFERAGRLVLEVPVVPAEQAADVALGTPEAPRPPPP